MAVVGTWHLIVKRFDYSSDINNNVLIFMCNGQFFEKNNHYYDFISENVYDVNTFLQICYDEL